MAFIEIVVPGLYAVAMLVLLVYGLNLYWLSARLVRDERPIEGPLTDRAPEAGGPADLPRVTVQLPVYNEALVVERVIDACARLDYPCRLLEIQVLDDSDDHTTELIAGRVDKWRKRGVNMLHVRRAERTGYKAGALQNGLEFAAGDFVAIFDADFIPTPDFLRRMIPRFDGPDVGVVQARWGHLNQGDSLLTRVQAFGLDAHFAVEQRVRGAAGCFINFNGTAGIWRRTCIESAGGWNANTLTEDLDLSYRAQLAGWKLKYVQDVEVPAEVPADTGAFRSQQFRWTKGSVQVALRLLPRLWRSPFGRRVKVEGTLHLTAHLVFPFIVLAALLHAPLVLMKSAGIGPGEWYFAAVGLGLTGFAGFALAQLLAQRSLYPDWRRRLGLFPLFMAGTMGLAVNNTHAVWEALRGRRSPFVRTPKSGMVGRRGSPSDAGYTVARLPAILWFEALAFLYSAVGLMVVAAAGQWAAVPFQLLFAGGFGLVVWFSVRDRRVIRGTRNEAGQFDAVGRGDYFARVFSVSDRTAG